MIVRVFPRGVGSGREAFRYLLKEDGRELSPVVLRGDPELATEITEQTTRVHKYTSGVLSFSPGEVVTPEMERDIMDRFEKMAFAGLEPHQYEIVWVRHGAGPEHNHHLHFVTPRTELTTGKSLNIAPPGDARIERFDTFRTLVNLEYNLSEPDEHRRPLESVRQPSYIEKLRRVGEDIPEHLKPIEARREKIHEIVAQAVGDGTISNRDELIEVLREGGMPTNRVGRDYISVKVEGIDKPIRLRGELYDERFRSVGELTKSYGRESGDEVPNRDRRITELSSKLERLSDGWTKFNRKHYPDRSIDDARLVEVGLGRGAEILLAQCPGLSVGASDIEKARNVDADDQVDRETRENSRHHDGRSSATNTDIDVFNRLEGLQRAEARAQRPPTRESHSDERERKEQTREGGHFRGTHRSERGEDPEASEVRDPREGKEKYTPPSFGRAGKHILSTQIIRNDHERIESAIYRDVERVRAGLQDTNRRATEGSSELKQASHSLERASERLRAGVRRAWDGLNHGAEIVRNVGERVSRLFQSGRERGLQFVEKTTQLAKVKKLSWARQRAEEEREERELKKSLDYEK